jgi:acetyl-CoA acetyltransferase
VTLASIAGVGMTPFGRLPELSLPEIAAPAVTGALEDAQVSAGEVEIAFVGNAIGGLATGQESIRGQVILRYSGITGIPIVNVENACASASTALHQAVLAVRSGLYRTALALGVEKMYVGDTPRTLSMIGTASDVAELGRHGLQFTSLYAMAAARYLRDFPDAAVEDFAAVAAKNSANGVRNPFAQFRRARTVAEVMDSRVIAEPLRLLMCSSIADGAAAAIVTSEPRDGSVDLLASIIRSGRYRADPAAAAPSSVATAGAAAYEQAAIAPADVGVVEVHDAAAPQELLHVEDLALVPRGEAGAALREDRLAVEGDLPVNPSGGLTSRGHAIGATGLAQIAELVWQLRDDAGARQARFAGRSRRVGLALNTGGRTVDDRAAIAVHVLELT